LWNKLFARLFLKKRESKRIFALLSFFSAIFLPIFFGKDGFSLLSKKLLDKFYVVWYSIVSHK